MATTLIVGDPFTTTDWADALRAGGHEVETCEHALAFQDRFSADPVDILIIDVRHADSVEGMLIPQARTIWPDCGIIAVVPDNTYRASAICQMGLWLPDRILFRPLSTKLLRATVTLLSVYKRSAANIQPASPGQSFPTMSPVEIEFPEPSLDRAAETQ